MQVLHGALMPGPMSRSAGTIQRDKPEAEYVLVLRSSGGTDDKGTLAHRGQNGGCLVSGELGLVPGEGGLHETHATRQTIRFRCSDRRQSGSAWDEDAARAKSGEERGRKKASLKPCSKERMCMLVELHEELDALVSRKATEHFKHTTPPTDHQIILWLDERKVR
jgi:hypothetical protein